MNATLKIFVPVGVVAAGVALYLLMRRQVANHDNAPVGAVSEIPSDAQPTGQVLVAGTVEAVGPGADVARQMGTAYVIVRGAGGGPPYAVKRLSLEGGRSAFAFSLTESDVMMPGMARPERPMLKIRFDADGDPMTELPGDVIATTDTFAWGAGDLALQATLFEGAR